MRYVNEPPIITAQHVTEPSVIENGLNEVIRRFPGVEITVTTDPDGIDDALRLLERAVADVRGQLASVRTRTGVVLVDGPNAQDEVGR